ncbi:unnamed protein product [Microthlaspi erraticum]|uniref:Uncharacterized protein n=1 Tax=Microthlaspi erraticum TaxID=1685480 RepID=A0A6D2IHA0_9BRAS|nr:unnamed protein product [Microthlaspi erraticum]
MEIMAVDDIGIGVDLFPPLSPLTFSLYDSFLTSHCSSCFSLLSPTSPASLYCSAACSLPDPPTVSQIPPDNSPILSSDIRAALRLLNSISFSAVVDTASLPHRLGGLLTNHHRIMADPSFSIAIQRAACYIAAVSKSDRENTELEEAAICCVLTNAVEVQDSTGLALGIALYDSRFSWINHSCSPTACYRFVISPPNSITTTSYHHHSPKIIPRIINTEKEQISLCSITSLLEGKTVGYGPKVITRSIKKIQSGEEITISYIDLLQPTGLRQSDLWSKYRFMCNCRRCAASPLAYVDSVLEGVLALEPEKTTVGHHHGATSKDDAVRKITDGIEEAIDGFLSDDINPETCCEKIENVLHHGIQIKADSEPPHHLRLHPSHHVALNAYITLATAYRIRSTDSETDTRKAFDMSRISAAYSLFLAGLSHHLVSAEPSLAISAASFWKSAGESLLDLARKFLTEEYDVECSECLMLVVETYNSQRDVKENLMQIVRCVTDISQVAWSFLTRGCSYLQKFESPGDYSFTVTSCEREESSEDQRGRNVLLLSFHCLLYADLLTCLCYGRKSHLLI